MAWIPIKKKATGKAEINLVDLDLKFTDKILVNFQNSLNASNERDHILWATAEILMNKTDIFEIKVK